MANNVTEYGNQSGICPGCDEEGNQTIGANSSWEDVLQQTRKSEWLIFPFLLLLATVGNLLMIFVFAREKHMRSTNWYMICMAAASLIFMWSYVGDAIWELSSAFGLPYRTLAHYEQLNRYKIVGAWVFDTSGSFSDWISVMFSLERLLVILNPFKYAWLQEITTARVASLIILVACSVTDVYDFIRFSYGYAVIGFNGDEDSVPGWVVQLKNVHSVVELSKTFGTFVALLTINTMVILAIRRHNRSAVGRQRSSQQEQSAEAARNHRNSNMLLMGCVGLYFFTQTLDVALALVDLVDPEEVLIPPIKRLHVDALNDVLFEIQYSFGFFVYMSFSRHYRTLLVESCFSRFRKTRKYNAPALLTVSSQNVPTVPTNNSADTVC